MYSSKKLYLKKLSIDVMRIYWHQRCVNDFFRQYSGNKMCLIFLHKLLDIFLLRQIFSSGCHQLVMSDLYF
jgi:hypothetical protein